MNHPALPPDFVMTPHGPMPVSHVVTVTSAQLAYASGDGRVVVEDKASGQIVAEYGSPRVAAPTGGGASSERMPPSDPWEATSADLRQKDGRGNHNGYFAYANDVWYMNEFRTTWTVPERPALPDPWQTFYVWNGLLGGNLQCVLTWGAGEPRYRIQNWAWLYGGEDGNTRYAVRGPEVPVKTGEQLTGVITLDDSTMGYTYSMVFQQYQDTKLTVLRSGEATQVVECFESYTKDVDFITRSKKVAMTDIHVGRRVTGQPSTLDWQVKGAQVATASGNNTVVVSDSASSGEIDFYLDWKR